MKLIKGSAAAKRYMAKIRSMKAGSKKKPAKKVGLGATKYIEKGETAKTKPKRIITITRFPKAKLQTKKNSGKPGTFKSFAGIHKDTKSHNVKINVLSGIKNDYAEKIVKYVKMLENNENRLSILRYKMKAKIDYLRSKEAWMETNNDIKKIKKHIISLKKHI